MLTKKTTSFPRKNRKKQKQYHRMLFKATLLVIFVGIVCIYSYLLTRIMSKLKSQNLNNEDESDRVRIVGSSSSVVDSNNHPKRRNKAVLIIAAVPYQSIRSLSLWSQLQCYTGNIDKVIIAAADYSKDVLDAFVAEAVQTIPNLKNGKTAVEIRYYNNDRYDLGLWCDALNDNYDNGNGGDGHANILHEYDEFLLINDSIMAIQKSSEMIDVMRSKNLTMASLTYSLLDGYWLEGNYRGFNRDGVKKYMEHTCVPNPCLKKKKINRQHRCTVETFEIPIARLFDRKDIWGLYHGDAPIEYFNATAKNRKLQTSPMWHSNYPYWDEVLRAKQHFPAVKISNRWAYGFLKKRNKEDHDRCITLLNQSEKATGMVSNFDTFMDKAQSVNQLQYRKGCHKEGAMCKKGKQK